MSRVSQVPQRSEVPEAAPDGVRFIFVLERTAAAIQGTLAYAAIVPGISAVDITGQAPAQQGVVQPGIELHLIIPFRGFHAYASQVAVPCSVGLLTRLIEIHPASFALQIQAGVFDRRIRQARLNGYGLYFLLRKTKIESGTLAGQRLLARTDVTNPESAVSRRYFIT